MSPIRLLQYFEQISQAPDAVPRLRRFILDLAVRGKLVEQFSIEGTADLAIEEIDRERGRLVAEGVIGSQLTIPPVREDQMPFTIPSTWRWVRFGNITYCRDGERIPVSREERQHRSGPYDYYGASGIIDKIDAFLFDKPLLLIGEDGANLVNRSTPIAFIAGGRYWVNNHAHVLDGISLEFLRFLEMFINATDLRPYVTGTAQPKMNQTKMNSIPIALPPFCEQHRIVAKVDELMALCNELEAAQARRERRRDRLVGAMRQGLNNGDTSPEPYTRPAFTELALFYINHLPRLTTRPEHIRRVRQTILNLAVQGRLVPQDPTDEPAAVLLKSIQVERQRLLGDGKVRQQELSPIDDEALPFSIPPNWKWVRMGEVIKLWNGYAFKSSDYTKEGVPVIRIGDLQNGEVVLSSVVFVGHDVAALVDQSIWIPENALLIAMSGATTGKVAFNRTGQRLLLNQRVGRLQIFQVHTDFVRFFFETIVQRNLSISFGTAIPNLSTRQISETAFPLPPLAEQHRIVAKVDQLMALCDDLEARLAVTAIARRQLLKATLHEALEGAVTQSCWLKADAAAGRQGMSKGGALSIHRHGS
jgi:type I restriction enzyme S subunit